MVKIDPLVSRLHMNLVYTQRSGADREGICKRLADLCHASLTVAIDEPERFLEDVHLRVQE